MKHNQSKKSNFIFEPNNYPLGFGAKLIEASAGTGKTFSLAHLVLRLLTEKEYSINEILVVSFTKATASEIKAIIAKRIVDSLKCLDDLEKDRKINSPDEVLSEWIKINVSNKRNIINLKKLLIEGLQNIEQADITTIHGFCYRTLKRDAIETGSNLNLKIEEDAQDLIKEIAYEYWQNYILELNPEHIKGLQHAGFNLDTLTSNILKIDSNPAINFKIENSNLDIDKPLQKQFEETFKSYWNTFKNEFKNDGAYLEQDLRDLAQMLRDQGIKDTKPYVPKPRKNRHETVLQWVLSFDVKLAPDSNHIEPFYIDIRNQKKLLEEYYHPHNLYELKKRHQLDFTAQTRPKLQESICKIWDGPAEIVWNHSLLWCLNLLSKKRRENGVMSNGDLLKALDPYKEKSETKTAITASNENLFKKLRNRYRAILIDEFQDTDPIQWRFLWHAFGKSKEHLLLMIGDPKQAIYKFRGGDLNTYIRARNEVLRIDILKNNFRTAPALMNGLNKLLSPGLHNSSLQVEELIPKSKETCLQLSSGKHPLQLIKVDNSENKVHSHQNKLPTKTNLEEIIPNVVSNYLLDLLHSQSQQIQVSDICVLVNNHNQAENIRSALTSIGLPTRLVSKGDVFKTEAALILQRFVNCLANPADSVNIRLIACSALIQWHPKDFKIAEENGDFDKLASRFHQWSNNLQSLGLLGCLSELLEGYTVANISKRGTLLSNLNQCSQLLQEEIHRNNLDPKAAAKWLKRQRLISSKQVPEERQPNSDIEENAINVITIHRSKGLQYKVVICPYLWQSPPISKGPLWHIGSSHNWLLTLNKGFSNGTNPAEITIEESRQEFERLTYVALTRAQKHLVFIWGKASNQEGNPLISLLFGPKESDTKIESLSEQKMNQWIESRNIPITLLSGQVTAPTYRWNKTKSNPKLSLGPKPKRELEQNWGRYSYSAWTTEKGSKGRYNQNQAEVEEGIDIDPQAIQVSLNEEADHLNSNKNLPTSSFSINLESPFSSFPRGPSAGNCLHKILERLDFQKDINCIETSDLIKEELLSAGIEKDLTSTVQKGLHRILNTPLGGELGNLSFSQINTERRFHELKFDIPISPNGKEINSRDISDIFLKNPSERFSKSYAKKLINLNINSKGFLTGSIDLVFADKPNYINAKWWVVDWKSNWIGSDTEEMRSCGPQHYDKKSMDEQMHKHHYPLQAHLYLLALHRLLRWRLPNYSPNLHLGGYVYLFLRGIPSKDEINSYFKTQTIPGLIIETAPVARVIALDKLFSRGNQ